MSFKRGDILICTSASHFIERGELVRFEGRSTDRFIEIKDKPGHYGVEDFRLATSAEIWRKIRQ